VKPARTRPVWFWPAASVALVFTLLCACVLHEPLWLRLGVFHLKPYFADWFAVLAASDARAAGADPYASPNPFDVLGRPHIYGPWWLELSRLGLTRDHNVLSGLGLALATLCAGAWMLRPRGPGSALAAAAVLAAPGFLLAYERANNDLVIVLLLALAGWAAGRGDGPGRTLAALALLFAAGLKIYPVAGLGLLLAARPAGRERDAAWLGLTAFGFVAVAWIHGEEFLRAVALVPRLDTVHGYGLPVIRSLWLDPAMLRGWLLAGLAPGVAFWVWRAWRGRRIPAGGPSPAADAWLLAGAGAWFLCYAVNVNFCYRIILLLLPAAGWFRLAQGPTGAARAQARWLVGGLIVTLWLTAAHPEMMQISTLFKLRVCAWTLGFENGLVLGLTLYLAWEAFRLGGARVRAYGAFSAPKAASNSAASTS
jgi:hypothetical protein